MSTFAVVWDYTDDKDLIDESRQAHGKYIKDLAEQGVLREAGAWADDSGALLVFDVNDASTLRSILDADPYTSGRVIISESINEWVPKLGRVAS